MCEMGVVVDDDGCRVTIVSYRVLAGSEAEYGIFTIVFWWVYCDMLKWF